MLQAAADLLGLERPEAEARAARLQRGDDLVDVITDHAEARVLRVLLDYSAEGELRIVRHGIRLVEDHQLDTWWWSEG